MCLVADALDQEEGLGVQGETDGFAVARLEKLLLLLGQAEGGHRSKAHGLHHLSGRRQLPFAAVDQDQVREPAEAGLLGGAFFGPGMPAESAPQYLLQHREIVGALHRLDAEMPVMRRLGPALFEDDHRAHRVLALDVRDVVALDPHRQCR